MLSTKQINYFFLTVLVLLVVISASAWADFVPGEILVGFRHGVIELPEGKLDSPIRDVEIKSPAVRQLCVAKNVTKIERVFKSRTPGVTTAISRTGEVVDVPDLSQVYKLVLPVNVDVKQAVKDFQALNEVVFAEPNYVVEPLSRYPDEAAKDYYYETSGKVFLDLVPETVGVKFVNGTTFDDVTKLATEYKSTLVSKHNYGVFQELKVPPGFSPQDFIAALNKEDVVEFAAPVYSSSGQKMILTDQFLVKFVPEMSDADIEAFNAKHRVEIISKEPWIGGTFLYKLKVTKDSELDALWMANLYHEQNFTLWAHPEFLTHAVAAVTVTSRHISTTWAAIKRNIR